MAAPGAEIPRPAALAGRPVVDHRAFINAQGARLIAIGVPAPCFDEPNYLAAGLTPKLLEGRLRVFEHADSDAKLQRILNIGIRLNRFPAYASLTPPLFYSFLDFLRTPAGADELAALQRADKLATRGGTDFEPHELGWIAMMDLQQAEMSNLLGEERRHHDDVIADLERRLRMAKVAQKEALAQVKTNHSPAGDYVALDSTETNRRCWAEYCNRVVATGNVPPPLSYERMCEAVTTYSDLIRKRHILEFLTPQARKDALESFVQRLIVGADQAANERQSRRFVASWQMWVASKLLRHPLKYRSNLCSKIPLGPLSLRPTTTFSGWLSQVMPATVMQERRQIAAKAKPLIPRTAELRSWEPSSQSQNARVSVLVPATSNSLRQIPFTRSKWEAGVRKLIGGGEMLDWKTDSYKHRGGGCFADAMKLLCDASEVVPGRLLKDHYTLAAARRVLCLPSDLTVPDGASCCNVVNFNDDASSGPFLFSFNCKRKSGLRSVLSSFVWDRFDRYARNEIDEQGLPYLTARVGFRSKLLDKGEAVKKLTGGKALGRAVIMLDAIEQFCSSPLYNVLSKIVSAQLGSFSSGFRNSVIRASTDWIKFFEEVRGAAAVVELDWSKFDRERPAEDIQFVIDVVISCFTPTNDREARLLDAYAIMMRRALIERPLLTDDGGVYLLDGMVPSGTLWTGFLDTALNILYIDDVLLDMGFDAREARPKCCGDDNLTLFYYDPGDNILKNMRTRLNTYYRAGIDEADFLIHRPPYHVFTEQAIFPPGTDLSKGTSRLLKDAEWVRFDDELQVDAAAGRSHRWRYHFFGKPKFLSCYWLESGLPIRPAKDNLEKLLFPETIQETIEDYMASLLSMVVDNPFNHHNVNHLKHRWIICTQILKYAVLGLKPEDIMWISRVKPEGDEDVPFPNVAQWRRQDEWVDLDNHALTRHAAREFSDFVAGVSSLYKRSSRGGLDSWHFMSLIRMEIGVGAGQWGNDVDAWIRHLRNNPTTKYLRASRRFRRVEPKLFVDEQNVTRARRALDILTERLNRRGFQNASEFALWLSTRLREAQSTN
ncbi:TPA_asm: fusion protein [Salvia miltiorrhiza amalgavirus 1]|nr:TPA_asm: fusion protein [Salvia miltiorrhiza amalgavirus 1]